jgi:hypothetical protein
MLTHWRLQSNSCQPFHNFCKLLNSSLQLFYACHFHCPYYPNEVLPICARLWAHRRPDQDPLMIIDAAATSLQLVNQTSKISVTILLSFRSCFKYHNVSKGFIKDAISLLSLADGVSVISSATRVSSNTSSAGNLPSVRIARKI